MAFSALYFGGAEFRPARNKRRMLLAMGVSGAGLMLMTLKPPALSFGFRVVHEIGDGALGVLIAVFVSRLFAKKSIGGSAGMVLSVQILGQMVGGLLLTPLGFRYGLAIPFLVGGGLLDRERGLRRAGFPAHPVLMSRSCSHDRPQRLGLRRHPRQRRALRRPPALGRRGHRPGPRGQGIQGRRHRASGLAGRRRLRAARRAAPLLRPHGRVDRQHARQLHRRSSGSGPRTSTRPTGRRCPTGPFSFTRTR